ncbi:sigma-E factor negative regulatory protein [Thermomonas sp.]
MKTAGIDTEMTLDATDLTQLSSREQLSALMDGALPADETRFLLRRLKHDAPLAECWERWRLSAEVMRGLVPAQRLPVDFAARVAASLRGEENHSGGLAATQAVATGRQEARPSTWLRWGGGAAVAASLAVVALMNQPAVVGSPDKLAGNTAVAAVDMSPSVADNTIALAPAPVRKTPVPQAPAQDPVGTGIESQAAALASAVAAVARPARNSRGGGQPDVTQATAVQATSVLAATNTVQSVDSALGGASNITRFLPQADITTRPWPRSVLPQSGNAGLTVGFGTSERTVAPYVPFQLRSGFGSMPPVLIGDPPVGDAAAPANHDTGNAANAEPRS